MILRHWVEGKQVKVFAGKVKQWPPDQEVDRKQTPLNSPSRIGIPWH
jgi:hypothetical protein